MSNQSFFFQLNSADMSMDDMMSFKDNLSDERHLESDRLHK